MAAAVRRLRSVLYLDVDPTERNRIEFWINLAIVLASAGGFAAGAALHHFLFR